MTPALLGLLRRLGSNRPASPSIIGMSIIGMSIIGIIGAPACTPAEGEGSLNEPQSTGSNSGVTVVSGSSPVVPPPPLVPTPSASSPASTTDASMNPGVAPGAQPETSISPTSASAAAGAAGAAQAPASASTQAPMGGARSIEDAGPAPVGTPIGGGGAVPPDAGPTEPSGIPASPDVGTAGDGDHEVGPDYSTQPELGDQGAPKGRTFRFTMPLAESALFDGGDPTLDPSKPLNQDRGISVYVPARYEDGTAAPVLVIQDGDGPFGLVSNALDNLTISEEPERKLPAFVVVAVQNGGSDAQGSERGLEYDTLSDRYARFIDEEVLPAVVADPGVRMAYPGFEITTDPSGRAALGCSSGGAAAFTMAWFRPDLFGRVVAYSTTLVDQQNHSSPEAELYPHGAWDYHSELELIANAERKPVRIFLNVNEDDLRSGDPESTFHNWVMANERTAAALAAKEYHYRYVFGLGAGHCDSGVQQATLADALVWVWRGYDTAVP